MSLDRRLLRQLLQARWLLAGAILAGFLAGIAAVIQSRLLSGILAGVFLGGQNLTQVAPMLETLMLALLARAGCAYAAEVAASAAAQQVKQRVREQLTAHLLALGPAYTQGERSGALVNTAVQGVEALDAYFSQFLPQLALAGLLPLAFLAVAFPLDPLSAAVLLLTGPLIPFFMFLIGSMSERLTRRQWTALGRMSAYFLDTLQGLVTLKTLGRSREQAGRIARVSEEYRAATMRVLRLTFLSALALELLGTIGTAIVAVEVGLRLLYGRMGFETALFLLLLAPDFYQPLRALGLRFHASMSGVSAARDIFKVLETPIPGPAPEPEPAPVLSAELSLSIETVSYTYPGRDRPALDGVSLAIPAGQTVALVGPSGAGKSTLAALLLGFIQPDAGAITVNGLPLATIPIEDWRRQVAWVPQRPYLFHGTLADNLRLARPEATHDDLRRAAAAAYLLDWIDAQPLGLDTPVGEGGARLSGGQAQRLALARAFLRDAPLLVLDEPTAHLDVELERLLEESTRRLCASAPSSLRSAPSSARHALSPARRSVLVIAHRLPTVLQADQIVVLEGGRVVEQGRHAELLARAGVYARLVSAYRAGTS